jgi:hypothetical protein
MYLEPIYIQWALLGGACICAFMIGKEWGGRTTNSTIEDTIGFLCDEGYIKHKTNSDGEIEIIKLRDDY